MMEQPTEDHPRTPDFQEASSSEVLQRQVSEVARVRITKGFEVQASQVTVVAGKGDPVDDFGLRRRFFKPYAELDQAESASRTLEMIISDNPADSEGSNSMGLPMRSGSASRKILEADSDHDQPPKMKKRKKSTLERNIVSRSSKAPDTGTSTILKNPSKKSEASTGKAWATADDFINPHVDSYAIFVMRDFVAYLIFMIVACFMIFGTRGPAYNYFSNVLSTLATESSFFTSQGFKVTYHQMQNRQNIWIFVSDVLLKLLYETSISPHDDDKKSRMRTVIRESMLFGAPQMRQVRVKDHSCSPVKLFEGAFRNCLDYYSEEIEDKDPFGLMDTSVWQYSPPSEGALPYTGKISTYSGGGFVMNFTADENFTRMWIDELRKQDWIRLGARAVFVDFTVYNPNTMLACAVKLVFEMPPFGGVIPSASFVTFKILRYTELYDFFIASCLLIFICFVVYYTYEEITQITRQRETYWVNKWNILDILILLCSYVALVKGALVLSRKWIFLREKLQYLRTTVHVSFDELVWCQSHWDASCSFLIFFVWLKILKFSTMNRTLSLILAAFARVGGFLIFATLMLIVYIIAFALFGYVKFGSIHREFKSYESSMVTMVRLVHGGFHFHHTPSHHGYFDGWLMCFTVLFILTVKTIFINIFVALVIHGHQMEVNEVNELSSPAAVGDVCREMVCQLLLFLGRYRIVERIQDNEVIKQDMRIYDALVAILRRHGFESTEIALILAKHKVKFSSSVSEEQMMKVYEDIFVRNQLFLEVTDHNLALEQMEKITRTVELYEQAITSILTKVDILTNSILTK